MHGDPYLTRPVERRFVDRDGMPKAMLSCGHIVTDRIEPFGDLGAIAAQIPGRPVHLRCYRCGEEAAKRR